MTNILREKKSEKYHDHNSFKEKKHEVNPRKSKTTAIKTLKLSQKRW